jgi:hypothetical protein
MPKFAIAAIVCGLGLASLGLSVARAEVLITVEEARLPASAGSSPITRGITRGPGIDQELPAANRNVPSPMPFRVRFETRNGIPIDLSTVRLTYLKATPVDLTSRVRKYITPSGIEISQAIAPPGIHFVQVDLKDMQGRAGTAIIKLTVANR